MKARIGVNFLIIGSGGKETSKSIKSGFPDQLNMKRLLKECCTVPWNRLVLVSL